MSNRLIGRVTIGMLSLVSCVYAGDPISTLGSQFELPQGLEPQAQESTVIVPRSFISARRMHDVLGAFSGQTEFALRGAKEIGIYAERSPSVVLVVTEQGLGSGTLLNSNGDILTNWHVVEGAPEVGVVFKPQSEGAQLTEADLVRAEVRQIDQVADLALIRAQEVPSRSKPIPLGDMDSIMVGADVHAIGHPTGEAWTYTRGFVSQVRKQYEWTGDGIRFHKANVVQTQTPINPGNSGGPLLNDDGALIGINSFKSQGEALNFAVAIDEIQGFLERRENRYLPNATPSTASCEPTALGEEYSAEYKATITYMDLDCDREADMRFVVPDDDSVPIWYEFDESGNGRVDSIFIDNDRDGGIDESYFDSDGDGKPDLRGFHRDGEIKPYRVEPVS